MDRFICQLVGSVLSIVLLVNVTTAQSIKTYFTQNGLSLNSYHFNLYDGTNSTSYSYMKMDSVCGKEVEIFYHHESGYQLPLRFDDDTVFVITSVLNCHEKVLYNFGLEVGDTITQGHYKNFAVVNKYDETLLNGEKRTRIDLQHIHLSDFWSSWIVGLGDVTKGLIPLLSDFEGGGIFVCAKLGDELLWNNPRDTSDCSNYSCPYPYINIVKDYIDSHQLEIRADTLFADQIEWDMGDDTIIPGHAALHKYETPGCYIVTARATNDCNKESEIVKSIPICIENPWKTDYTFDTLRGFEVHEYSNQLEFAYTGPYLYRSTNEGETWKKIDLPRYTNGNQRSIADLKMFNENDGVLTCTFHGSSGDEKAILVTHDGGLSWSIKGPDSYYALEFEIAEDGRAWVLGAYDVYRTFDYGETWETLNYSPSTFSIYDIQLVNDSLLIGRSFTGIQPDGYYNLIKSYDNGSSWEKNPAPDIANTWYFFDENKGYGFHREQGMSITEDGGQSWDFLNLPFEVQSYSFHDLNHGWLLDPNNIIHYTKDGMQTFRKTNCGGQQIRHIQALSDTTAYAITGNPQNFSMFGISKLMFKDELIIDCALTDNDGDGYTINEDCNDSIPAINPGATEIPNNGIDEDCDGADATTSTQHAQYGFTIYPNPSNGTFTLNFKDKRPLTYSISVYNLTGHLVHHQENQNQLNLHHASEGIYFLHFRDLNTNRVITKRIIISN